jgi:hypothetical protein
MADTHPASLRDPGKTLLLAWLVPGAGHWYAGRPARGTLYAVTVIAVFVAGVAMGGLSTVSVYGHKWAFLLQMFDGPLTIVTALLGLRNAGAPEPSRVADLGLTFTLVSAAFNVLVMADAYYLADRPVGDASDDAEESS